VKLIVGLGNPGIEYQFTPHNLGFLTIDRIANGLGIEVRNRQCRALTARATIDTKTTAGEPVILAKPETYMNLSGLSVRELVEEHQIDVTRDLIVIYDELDLPWGSLRVRPKGSAAGHNGTIDVIEKIGTQEFPRIRLGVHPGHSLPSGKDYLLSRFTRQQTETLDAFVDLAADATESIIAEGVEKSMTKFNRRAQGNTNEEE